ncbi:MAG: bacteriohemerythrin [Acetivibrionales bacterium]
MAIEWKDSYSIGIEEIDKQHKALFDAINRLLNACSQGRGKEEVGSVIKFLGDYVVTHFSSEEKLQQEYNYPDFAAHKGMHDKFIEDFTQLKEQIETEGVNARSVILVNRTVVDWLTRHIKNVDKKLGEFLKGVM